jgi:hypothetical protein
LLLLQYNLVLKSHEKDSILAVFALMPLSLDVQVYVVRNDSKIGWQKTAKTGFAANQCKGKEWGKRILTNQTNTRTVVIIVSVCFVNLSFSQESFVFCTTKRN